MVITIKKSLIKTQLYKRLIINNKYLNNAEKPTNINHG